MKVNDQTHSLSSHFEVSEELGFVDRQNVFNTLELKNYRVFNQNIHSVTTVEVNTFEINWQWHLPLKVQTPEL